MAAASMFGIFDENISEMPALVAAFNRWGAQIETDRSMLQERMDSGFAEIRDAVLQLRGQVLTQSANTEEVSNHIVRLEQSMEQGSLDPGSPDANPCVLEYHAFRARWPAAQRETYIEWAREHLQEHPQEHPQKHPQEHPTTINTSHRVGKRFLF